METQPLIWHKSISYIVGILFFPSWPLFLHPICLQANAPKRCDPPPNAQCQVVCHHTHTWYTLVKLHKHIMLGLKPHHGQNVLPWESTYPTKSTQKMKPRKCPETSRHTENVRKLLVLCHWYLLPYEPTLTLICKTKRKHHLQLPLSLLLLLLLLQWLPSPLLLFPSMSHVPIHRNITLCSAKLHRQRSKGTKLRDPLHLQLQQKCPGSRLAIT